jgi:transcriptional regulator NrdR family protein
MTPMRNAKLKRGDLGLHCPKCGATGSAVVRVRPGRNCRRRERECDSCRCHWFTTETAATAVIDTGSAEAADSFARGVSLLFSTIEQSPEASYVLRKFNQRSKQ